MVMSKLTLNRLLVTGVAMVGMLSSASSLAQAGGAPIVCPGYKASPTKVPGQRVGKKVGEAYELYSADQTNEALAILLDIDTDGFDQAYVDKFIGGLYASTDTAKALKYMKRAVDAKELNDGEQANAMRTLADLYMMEKEWGNAVNAYKALLTYTCKEDPDVYLRLGQAYYSDGKLAQIIEPADKAINAYKQAGKPNKNAYQLKIASYYERKMYKETVEVGEELVRIFPDNPQFWVQLGQFYFLVEDYKKALAIFDVSYGAGFLDKPNNIKILAQLYATNEMPYKAATVLEKHIKSGMLKADAALLSSVGNSYLQAREYKKAAEYFGKAADMETNYDYYRRQGTLLLAVEDYKGALTALEKALKGGEKIGSIHMAMMEAYFYQGKFKDAYEHVNLAMKDKDVARSARSWKPYIEEKAKNRKIKL